MADEDRTCWDIIQGWWIRSHLKVTVSFKMWFCFLCLLGRVHTALCSVSKSAYIHECIQFVSRWIHSCGMLMSQLVLPDLNKRKHISILNPMKTRLYVPADWTKSICEVIKRNESYVGNFDFEIHLIIVWNSFCILLFSAGQNCPYLLNRKSDFDEVFSKTKLSGCFTKYVDYKSKIW